MILQIVVHQTQIIGSYVHHIDMVAVQEADNALPALLGLFGNDMQIVTAKQTGVYHKYAHVKDKGCNYGSVKLSLPLQGKVFLSPCFIQTDKISMAYH